MASTRLEILASLAVLAAAVAGACGSPTSPDDPDEPDAADAAGGGDGASYAPPYDPAGVVGYSFVLGPTGIVYPNPEPAQNPAFAGQVGRGFGLDTLAPDGTPIRKVFAMFSQHDDVPGAVQINAVLQSTDGARTFGGYASSLQAPPAFALELRDGRILSFGFVPTARSDSPGSTHLTLSVQESRDAGTTWTPFDATVTVPTMTGGYGRVSGHPIQLADGTILLPYYLVYAGDAGSYRSELLASTDGGRTFVRRASIAIPPAGTQYPEPDIVKLQDGSLYAVFRHQIGPTLSPLLFARSTDDGATWSAPAPVLISFAGAPATPRIGINPQLVLMPNGVLVLSSGRPDNFIAVSTDPSHVAWKDARVTYVNYPAASSAGYGAAVRRYHGSSGNTGLVAIDSSRVVQFGDNCANGWGCPAADSDFTIDNRNRVWRRIIEVATPDVGKIDLLSKLQRGLIRVTTDMTWSATAHPRARPEGAFDGSTEYWSSAVKSGQGGAFTVELDQPYDLTRVGLAIRLGAKGSASVFTSLDGQHWDAAPIVTASARTHQALEYFVLPRPVRAAYVKVVLENLAPCDAELGAACTFLNELELYSTVDSFENDPVAVAPRGYTDVASAWVTDYQVGDTRRALRLIDSSETDIARATWIGAAGTRKRLELSVEPVALTGGFLFGIRGKNAAGATVTAYHLAVLADGSVAHYSAASATWTPLTSAGAVPLGAFTDLRVDADLGHATIYLAGVPVGTVAPSWPGAISLHAHTFSSAGTLPTGDHVLIDDVYFQ